eukprot:sb/3463181/
MTYCIASEALMYPFNKNPSITETIFSSFKRAYLNVFGDIGMEAIEEKIIEGHCSMESFESTFGSWTYNDSLSNWTCEGPEAKCAKWNSSSDLYDVFEAITAASNNDEPDDWCDSMSIDVIKATTVGEVNFYITFCLLCTYLLFVNIMLINLLIAIFSNTYADSEAKSGIIYKTQRAEVILQYREHPWLPNPISLIYFFLMLFKKIYLKCVCRRKLYRSQIKRLNRQNASFNAFRASLIEAECMQIFLRKKKQKAVSVTTLVEKLHTKVAFVQQSVEKLEKVVKKGGPSGGMSGGGAFGQFMPPHRHSLLSPYQDAPDVKRAPLLPEQIPWSTMHVFYDPTEYTSEIVEETDTEEMSKIKFNEVDGAMDRTSLTGNQYQLVDGDPINPCGRTGLVGRGLLKYWGPNKFAVTIITRWARPATGNVFNIRNRQVAEVLLVKMAGIPNLILPKIQAKEKIDSSYHKKLLRSLCYNHDKKSPEAAAVEKMIDASFEKSIEVYKGYFDDAQNTDNAWVEVSVTNVHVEGTVAETATKGGIDVEQVTWVMLNKKAEINLNDAWLMKLACNKLQCYNPWRGEKLGISSCDPMLYVRRVGLKSESEKTIVGL